MDHRNKYDCIQADTIDVGPRDEMTGEDDGTLCQPASCAVCGREFEYVYSYHGLWSVDEETFA